MSRVQLRRVDEAQNLRRFYTLALQPDLFGGCDLVREWGRIGQAGRVMIEAFTSLDEAARTHDKIWQGKVRDGYVQAEG